ncbi:MAG: NUDIX hydrolase [Clostridia bacterium]|nr:NUDIX hydrolase [Clostridia bacterium]
MQPKTDKLRETLLESREIYDGRVLRVFRDEVELPDGRPALREVVRHGGAVCVLPLFPDGRVIVEYQYRYGAGRVTCEIPAGKLEPGEDPAAAALRELEEETGWRAARLVDLGLYYGSPAILDEQIRMYVALGLTPGERHPDEDENILLERIPLAELTRRVLAGEIPDGKTQCAALRAAAMLADGTLSPG